MADRTLEEIVLQYICLDYSELKAGRYVFKANSGEVWKTDDLLELGVIINKILRERADG